MIRFHVFVRPSNRFAVANDISPLWRHILSTNDTDTVRHYYEHFADSNNIISVLQSHLDPKILVKALNDNTPAFVDFSYREGAQQL